MDYTKYLLNHFAKPIYFVDGGDKVMTGRSLMNTANGNIVRTAYRDWLWKTERKTLSDQRPSWDLVTVYFAIEGQGQFFEIFDNGYLEFDVDKGCRWVQSSNSTNQHFVLQKNGVEKDFSDYLNDIISRSLPKD